MPIIKSAKKALRKSLKNRERNLARKRSLAKTLKTFERLVKAKKTDEAKQYFPQVQKALDKAAKQGIIKRNKAARNKSRLSKLLKV
ncbi:MAG: 30S ribosomal protein S20 [bacterium]|nr:30S ribosomal protein S20 [bacterium]